MPATMRATRGALAGSATLRGVMMMIECETGAFLAKVLHRTRQTAMNSRSRRLPLPCTRSSPVRCARPGAHLLDSVTLRLPRFTCRHDVPRGATFLCPSALVQQGTAACSCATATAGRALCPTVASGATTPKSLLACILCRLLTQVLPVAVFGISSWVTVNSTFIELPLFAATLPEGWAIAAYIGIAIQLANVFPLAYSLWRSAGAAPSYVPDVSVLLAAGTAATLALAWCVAACAPQYRNT